MLPSVQGVSPSVCPTKSWLTLARSHLPAWLFLTLWPQMVRGASIACPPVFPCDLGRCVAHLGAVWLMLLLRRDLTEQFLGI